MSLEAWGDEGNADDLYTQDRVDEIIEEETAELKDKLTTRDKEIEQLRESLAEIREVWAGSECGQPVYAQEAYAIRLCKQMYQLAVDELAKGEGDG